MIRQNLPKPPSGSKSTAPSKPPVLDSLYARAYLLSPSLIVVAVMIAMPSISVKRRGTISPIQTAKKTFVLDWLLGWYTV